MATTVKDPVMDAILAPEKLRALLAITRREPLSVALAITSGDEEAVLLLHKTAGPKKVMAQLKSDAAKAKATLNMSMARFGMAQVDEEYDRGILRIAINKEAPDKLRIKLTQLVKRFSFRAVEFTVDPALELEHEGEQDAPPAVKSVDPVVMMGELQMLVRRLGAAGPRLAEAQALARRAGMAIKQQDLAEAGEALALLRATLDAPGATEPNAASPAEDGHLQSYDKARRLWVGTVKAVDAELLKLTAAIKAAYDPEGLGDAVAGEFTALVGPVVGRFDAGLAAGLQAVIDADPARRPTRLAEARGIVAGLQADLAAAPMLGLLDANPIAPVAIARPITAALAAIAGTLG